MWAWTSAALRPLRRIAARHRAWHARIRRLDTGPQSLSPGERTIVQGRVYGAAGARSDGQRAFPALGLARRAAGCINSNSQLGADDNYTKWDAEGTRRLFVRRSHVQCRRESSAARWAPIRCRATTCSSGAASCSSRATATGQLLGRKYQLRPAHVLPPNHARDLVRGRVRRRVARGRQSRQSRSCPAIRMDWLKSASVFVAADTPVGPAYLGYGRAPGRQQQLFIFISADRTSPGISSGRGVMAEDWARQPVFAHRVPFAFAALPLRNATLPSIGKSAIAELGIQFFEMNSLHRRASWAAVAGLGVIIATIAFMFAAQNAHAQDLEPR